MKIVKKLMAMIAIGTLSISMVACGSGTAGEKTSTSKEQTTNASKVVIAKVGDQEIYKDAFDEQMGYLDYMMQMQFGTDYTSNEEAMAYYEAQKLDVLQYLVESEVLLQKAKEDDKVEVTEEQVQEELDYTIAEFESEEAFNQALQESGLTLEELKDDIRDNLIISKMVTAYTEGAEVTDEDVTAYYNENKEEFVTKPGAIMSHILVATEDEAKDIKTKYDAGTTFEELAMEFGTDGTKANGGLLGYIEYDDAGYDADFLAGAKTLKEGEVSAPVQTQFGYHLIKVQNIQTEESTMNLEDVKEEIRTQLEQDKQFEQFNNYLDQWKSEMNIETFEDRL